jgi:hypothetical protein
MKDADDWEFILDTVDALFYGLANGIASRENISLVDSHEGLWESFEQGFFRLVGTDDGVGVVPCPDDEDRRAAMAQNQPLADYRRHVIEEAVAAA